MKINKKALLLGTMAFVLVAASGMVSAYASGSSGTKKAKVQTITEGVCIGSVDVGGMTKEEAKKAVEAYVDSIKDTSFALKGANGSFDATAQEMSVSADTDAAVDEALSVCHEGSLIDRFVESEELKKGNVAVNMYLSVDKQKTANMIYDKSDELNIKAVDNSLQRNGDSFDFVPGQEGKEVDVVKSVYAINDFLQNSWDGSANEIELVTNTVQPRGSKEELSKIKDNLGGFSTDFSSSAAGRAANVKNACSLINGSVIYPGEQFSVYEAISPITTDNGYQIAGAYENGQVVDSVGGGVCQVATTLYNAVIRAELDIVQRYNHSMIVSYVKPSDDAAIAGTYKDLKFKNNLDNPVYIEGYCSGGIITFNVYGVETRPANRKISHFDRERIPERVVHAKGSGAFGYFEVTNDVTKYTCADFLSQIGKKTEMLARFSTVGGEKGSADTARDPRGFALKFYTEQGNYDMVGNNTPVFFIRDGIKFPDFIHTQKRNPISNLPDPDAFWDFLSLTPESIHQVTILFSDRGTPNGFRHMHGFSSHTFMWYNANGEHVWIKWHFKTAQGVKNFTNEQATELAGTDPNYATRDLYESIEKGDYPAWNAYVQIMTPEEANHYKFDPFDITKVWYQGDYPLIPVGRFVLNRNPENHFNEIEQAAFSPGNFVPGIAASPDKMLQVRLFSYPDTHRHRLGSNFDQLPVNAPKCPMHNYQRDGHMNTRNDAPAPNYYPNSFEGPAPDAKFTPPALDVQGLAARHEYPLGDIDFVQTGELYGRVLSDYDKTNLINNIVGHIKNAQQRIQLRQAALFYKAHTEYGTRIAQGLGLSVDRVKQLAEMSQEDRVKATAQ